PPRRGRPTRSRPATPPAPSTSHPPARAAPATPRSRRPGHSRRLYRDRWTADHEYARPPLRLPLHRLPRRRDNTAPDLGGRPGWTPPASALHRSGTPGRAAHLTHLEHAQARPRRQCGLSGRRPVLRLLSPYRPPRQNLREANVGVSP